MINNTFNEKLFPDTTLINDSGHLTVGNCDTVELTKTYGTPLYVIDKTTIINRISDYKTSLNKYYNNYKILYASKSFACTAIYKLLNDQEIGIDVVSGGEIYAALKSGFNVNNIYFHGNNKSYKEIEFAIDNNITNIVCDNFLELDILDNLSKSHNKTINVIIRLTPGIECHTHEYIKTGHIDSKFGFNLEDFDLVLKKAKEMKNLNLTGLHAHIGSQIFEIKPYIDTINILLNNFSYAKNNYNIEFKELNIGGGIGISYTNNDDPFLIEEWSKLVSREILNYCKRNNLNPPKLLCEPGRSIIGRSGITLYTVGNIKSVPGIRKFVSVDGGMADNPRPITYKSIYEAVVANKMNAPLNEKVTIAGRYCETGDILIKDITLPEIKTNDVIAVLNTGAYNYSMSSNYNLVPRPACILVENGVSELIIKRETYEDIISNHVIPKMIM